MNNEIKEILYYWEKYHFEDCMIDGKECKLLYNYITNLQQENFNLRENILIHKMSFKSDDKSLEHLINMPSYEELQQLEQEHKKINGELREENSKLEIALQNIQEDYDRRIEENKRLKETNVYCNRTDCVGRIKDSRKYDSVYQEKEDYKSRCEKAIEYIKENQEEYVTGKPMLSYWAIDNLLNILQNGSEEK